MNRLRTRLTRAAAAGAVAGLGWFMTAAPAAAGVGQAVPAVPGFDCESPPNPTMPTAGALGDFDTGPREPRDGDPFKAAPRNPQPTHPKSTKFKEGPPSIYEVYGWGGLTWTNYEQGCVEVLEGLKKAGNPAESGAFVIANSGFKALVGADQAAVQITRWATDARATSVIDPMNEFAADTIGSKIFMPMAFLTVALAGLLVMRRGNEGDIDHSARDGAWTAFVMAAAFAAVIWPTVVAPKFDGAVRDTIEYGNSTISAWSTNGRSQTLADSFASSLHRGNAYETWKRGMFGGNSACANKYAPALFRAGAVSRAESGIKPVGWDEELLEFLVGEDGFKEKVFEQRRDQYKDVVADIKKDDICGDAYEYIAGRANGERILAMILGWFAFLLNGLFIAVMNLLLLFSSVTIRFFIAFLPLIALVAGIRKWKHHLIGPAKYVFSVALGAIYFGFGTMFLIAIYGWMIGSGMSVLAVMGLMLLCTAAVAWLLWGPMKDLWPPVAAKKARAAREKWAEQQRWAREKNAASGQWLREARSMRDRSHRTPDEVDALRKRWQSADPAEARTLRALGAAAGGGAVKGAVVGGTKAAVAGALTGGVGAGAVVAAAGKTAAAGAAKRAGAHRLNGSTTAAGLAAGTAAKALGTRLGRDADPAEARVEDSRTRPSGEPLTGRLFHPPEYTESGQPRHGYGATRTAPAVQDVDGTTTHVITSVVVPHGHRTDPGSAS